MSNNRLENLVAIVEAAATKPVKSVHSGRYHAASSDIEDKREPADHCFAEPDNIYTELIIVEHALRSQYIELQRSRRRGLLFFGSFLAGALFLTYRVWYNASIYKLIRLAEQLSMIALYITLGLFLLTGMFTKVFSVAPRFLADTNKGLKTLNFRVVKTSTTIKERMIRVFVNPVFSDDPAGPVKLMLSPREFSPQYIENWEVFRDEYWERQRRRRNRAKRNRRKHEKKMSR